MIIGICGFIGAGKDTAADYLGWNRELLEGRTKEAREWREQVDPWWAKRLNMPQLTPRWILQHWGTEVGRNAFHTDIWIASLENKLRQSANNIVISDCRFRNEVAAIKNIGGCVIWIQRGIIPHWYDIAAKANHGDAAARRWLDAEGVHASEYSWAGTTFDHVVENNRNVAELYDQLSGLLAVGLEPTEHLVV